MFGENICIEIVDNNNSNFNTNDTLDGESLEEFNGDSFLAKQLDYKENFILSDLKKIADYYQINTRKLRKEELIQEIVIFECDPQNSEVYLRRLQAWYWLNELKKDAQLKQYILF